MYVCYEHGYVILESIFNIDNNKKHVKCLSVADMTIVRAVTYVELFFSSNKSVTL